MKQQNQGHFSHIPSKFEKAADYVKSHLFLTFMVITGVLAVAVPAINMLIGDQIGSNASNVVYKVCWRKLNEKGEMENSSKYNIGKCKTSTSDKDYKYGARKHGDKDLEEFYDDKTSTVKEGNKTIMYRTFYYDKKDDSKNITHHQGGGAPKDDEDDDDRKPNNAPRYLTCWKDVETKKILKKCSNDKSDYDSKADRTIGEYKYSSTGKSSSVENKGSDNEQVVYKKNFYYHKADKTGGATNSGGSNQSEEQKYLTCWRENNEDNFNQKSIVACSLDEDFYDSENAYKEFAGYKYDKEEFIEINGTKVRNLYYDKVIEQSSAPKTESSQPKEQEVAKTQEAKKKEAQANYEDAKIKAEQAKRDLIEKEDIMMRAQAAKEQAKSAVAKEQKTTVVEQAKQEVAVAEQNFAQANDNLNQAREVLTVASEGDLQDTKELARTGPMSTVSKALVLGTITASVFYYIKSRKG